jgi:dTDP-4-amino-4,6-dideoxygalactose transaminase
MSSPEPKRYRVPSKDYGRQYAPFMDELMVEVERVLREEDPILGASVERFESEFAAWCGATHGIGTGSGTDAIYVALRALGIGPGDEVVTQANTFVATVTAIALTGARPVLVDPDHVTMSMTAAALGSALSPRTRAVIPVHLYGRLAPMDEIAGVCERAQVAIVEDAAQAHGARDAQGRAAGSFGAAGCFSFHPSKLLGAFGDGGILVTKDGDLAGRARRLRHLGKRTKYDVEDVAPNTKLDTLQAAILRMKLPFVERWIARHRAVAAIYARELQGAGDLVLPATTAEHAHVHHLFVVRTRRRDDLRAHLREAGINAGLHYPRPPHLQAMGIDWPYEAGSFPVAEELASTVLSLPISHELSDAEIDHVCRSVWRFFAS